MKKIFIFSSIALYHIFWAPIFFSIFIQHFCSSNLDRIKWSVMCIFGELAETHFFSQNEIEPTYSLIFYRSINFLYMVSFVNSAHIVKIDWGPVIRLSRCIESMSENHICMFTMWKKLFKKKCYRSAIFRSDTLHRFILGSTYILMFV